MERSGMTCVEARQELEKVSSLVLTARRLLSTGALVDLAAIRQRVLTVCSSVEGMSREDAQSLREELAALVDRLDHLGIDLRDQLQRMHPH